MSKPNVCPLRIEFEPGDSCEFVGGGKPCPCMAKGLVPLCEGCGLPVDVCDCATEALDGGKTDGH